MDEMALVGGNGNERKEVVGVGMGGEEEEEEEELFKPLSQSESRAHKLEKATLFPPSQVCNYCEHFTKSAAIGLGRREEGRRADSLPRGGGGKWPSSPPPPRSVSKELRQLRGTFPLFRRGEERKCIALRAEGGCMGPGVDIEGGEKMGEDGEKCTAKEKPPLMCVLCVETRTSSSSRSPADRAYMEGPRGSVGCRQHTHISPSGGGEEGKDNREKPLFTLNFLPSFFYCLERPCRNSGSHLIPPLPPLHSFPCLSLLHFAFQKKKEDN